ncbi:hypothetical protein Lal_00029196 [Lupinus albus]|uniref:Uncharacterized protein n=1 Tax=Lupinus albus TaxID=3870 RepID=A0A6A4P138_LUPAL|nr:hypothetical protein Lalb_Chr19g0131581 [Lupinus albus]KAF1885307.1 hypothetical protein Lal_00029196 [Lupinus albus]
MGSTSTKKPELVELRKLIPLRPWQTPPPPLTKLRGQQYMKLKKPIIKNGVKIYWHPKISEEEFEEQIEIPYAGIFEFFDKLVGGIKRWSDKFFGQIFS